MATRLYFTQVSGGPEPIEELSVVRLSRSIQIRDAGHLPAGSLGAVVFVHGRGEAFEIEFIEPFEVVTTLTAGDFEVVEEATRERIIAASNSVQDRNSKA